MIRYTLSEDGCSPTLESTMPFPSDALFALIAYLRDNKSRTLLQAIDAALDLLRYAAHTAINTGLPLAAASTESYVGVGTNKLADKLESLTAAPENSVFTVPPWLMTLLIEVIKRMVAG